MAHALIFGASGISGWSILNQTRTYPSTAAFSRITGTSNRPFTLAQACIPADDRICIASGINLTKSADEVAAMLREKVPDAETISHVFFTAYIQENDFQTLKEINTRLLEVAVTAVEKVSPSLKVVVLQTGGKGYGLEFPDEIGGIHPPLRENMPRIPKPWYDNIFYYTQYDLLAAMSKGKSWTFSEIRPDGIVGFAPGINAMNMAQGIAIYLCILREVYGKGAVAPYPGSEKGYRATHTDTFQDMLSRMEIYAGLNPDKCGDGGVFNIACPATSWSQVWPGMCAYWGLEGTGPSKSTEPMLEFVGKHKGAWKALAKRTGASESIVDEQGWGHTEFMLVQWDFDRQYDLSRAREAGFSDDVDTLQAYELSWGRMQEAGFLPKFF